MQLRCFSSSSPKQFRFLYGRKPFPWSAKLLLLNLDENDPTSPFFSCTLTTKSVVEPLEDTSFVSYLSRFSLLLRVGWGLTGVGLCTSWVPPQRVSHGEEEQASSRLNFSIVMSLEACSWGKLRDICKGKKSLTSNVLPKSFKHCTDGWSSSARSLPRDESSGFCLVQTTKNMSVGM